MSSPTPPIVIPPSRPASFPSPTTRRPSLPESSERHSLAPSSSLPSHLRLKKPASFPISTPPLAIFPQGPHSPLSRPAFLPSGSAASTPSLSIANDASPGDEATAQNIVILLDGTGNMFSNRNSNVIKTLSVLEADETQLLYYSSGVGTVLPDHASTWGKVRTAIAEGSDKMLAWNFRSFVCDAYKYLMDFYRAGDKVYIFGFSRGAYSARALAGMIQKVGLLPPGNYNQIALAYEIYIQPDSGAASQSMGQEGVKSVIYRQIFGISRTVRIEFLGVWDTVSSLGGITLPRLPFANKVKSVKFFRHALALDERRARFAPEYRHLDPTETEADPVSSKAALAFAQTAHDIIHSHTSTAAQKAEARHALEELLDQRYPEIGRARVVLDGGQMETRYLRRNVECWFMGCHSDVGGGNDLNGDNSLSNIPFRWMLREAVQCGLRLEAVGVCLQPAIYLHPAVVASSLIPTELIRILREELRGETVEFETENRVRSIVDQHLPHGRLVEILNLAAAYDSGVGPSDGAETSPSEVISEMERRKHAEGLGDEGTDVGTEAGDWRGLERNPDPRGMPICPDGLMLGTESLRGVWWILEGLVMQTRLYKGKHDTGRDVWRANLGRPRQMAVGQYIHRSVQKRLRFERPLDQKEEEEEIVQWWKGVKAKPGKAGRKLMGKKQVAPVVEVSLGPPGTGYLEPRAELPIEWEMTWDGLRRGMGGMVWEE